MSKNQSKENSQDSERIYRVLNVMAWIMNAIIVGIVIYAGWVGWTFLSEVIFFSD